MDIFERFIRNKKHVAWGTDGESVDAVKLFFWGHRDGLVMELGAADGSMGSESYPSVKYLGWHRILVEGSPSLIKNIKHNAPDALIFHCAVCSRDEIVHYATRGLSSGILEYMQPIYMARFVCFKYRRTRRYAALRPQSPFQIQSPQIFSGTLQCIRFTYSFPKPMDQLHGFYKPSAMRTIASSFESCEYPTCKLFYPRYGGCRA